MSTSDKLLEENLGGKIYLSLTWLHDLASSMGLTILILDNAHLCHAKGTQSKILNLFPPGYCM